MCRLPAKAPSPKQELRMKYGHPKTFLLYITCGLRKEMKLLILFLQTNLKNTFLNLLDLVGMEFSSLTNSFYVLYQFIIIAYCTFHSITKDVIKEYRILREKGNELKKRTMLWNKSYDQWKESHF